MGMGQSLGHWTDLDQLLFQKLTNYVPKTKILFWAHKVDHPRFMLLDSAGEKTS